MLSQLKTYYRPQSVDEALALLASNRENTTVIAGGTHINAHMDPQTKTVIDLQSVGLNALTVEEERLTLGAMVRLQTLVESSQVPALLQKMAHREGPNTFRNAATVGGVVVGADGESELLAALLVFEAVVEIQSTAGSKMLPLTEFLAAVPATLNGGLLTAVTLKSTGQTTSARVARTPADRPRRSSGAQRHCGDHSSGAVRGGKHPHSGTPG